MTKTRDRAKAVVPVILNEDQMHPLCRWFFDQEHLLEDNQWVPGESLHDTRYRTGPWKGGLICFLQEEAFLTTIEEHCEHHPLWDGQELSNQLRCDPDVYDGLKEWCESYWHSSSVANLKAAITAAITLYYESLTVSATEQNRQGWLPYIHKSLHSCIVEIADWCGYDYSFNPELWFKAATGVAFDVWSEEFQQAEDMDLPPVKVKSRFAVLKKDLTDEEKASRRISAQVRALVRRGSISPAVITVGELNDAIGSDGD